MLLFIVDNSVVVAIHVHSAVSIAIWAGLGSLKNGRYEDLMACKCDVSCVTVSRVQRPTQMAIDAAEWTYIATVLSTE